MPSPKIAACEREQCNEVIDLAGRRGRPPHYCSIECRRAGYAAAEARRRAERRAEIARLRELVNKYETALAA